MKHWAINYLGAPWSADGTGPDSYSCWGLVRAVYADQRGVVFPILPLDPEAFEANVRGIKQAARVGDMAPAAGAPQDMDIVLMNGFGHLHCGVCLLVDGRLGVLHCAHTLGVVFQPFRDATLGMKIELWRKRC